MTRDAAVLVLESSLPCWLVRKDKRASAVRFIDDKDKANGEDDGNDDA
jgi:hypothetical protein